MRLLIFAQIVALISVSVLGIGCTHRPETDLKANITNLVKLLESDSPTTRREAAAAIGELGPKTVARSLTSVLLNGLADPDSSVRKEIVLTLGDIRAEPFEVGDELRRIIRNDPDIEVRCAALLILVDIGSKDENTINILIEALGDEESKIRSVAACGLWSIGSAGENAVPELIKRLKDEDICVRVNSIRAIGTIDNGGNKEAIEEGIRILNSTYECKDCLVTNSAIIRALGAFGNEAKSAVPILIDIIVDPSQNELLRESALIPLARISSDPLVLEVLQDILNGEILNLRCEAARAIRILGPRAEGAVPALITALLYDWPEQIFLPPEAAYALGDIGSASITALPELRNMAEMGLLSGRIAALYAIHKIIPEDPYPYQTVIHLAGSDQPSRIREAAIGILPEFGCPVDSLPLVIDALGNEATRFTVIRTLASFGSLASDAIPHLREVLETDPSGRVSLYAYEAIKVIQGEGSVLFDVIMQ